MYDKLKKLRALLDESQQTSGIIETWTNIHQGEPIANLFGSFVKQQMVLNETLVEAIEYLDEYGPKQHECATCGGPADHWHAASWYCHTHLAKWID